MTWHLGPGVFRVNVTFDQRNPIREQGRVGNRTRSVDHRRSGRLRCRCSAFFATTKLHNHEKRQHTTMLRRSLLHSCTLSTNPSQVQPCSSRFSQLDSLVCLMISSQVCDPDPTSQPLGQLPTLVIVVDMPGVLATVTLRVVVLVVVLATVVCNICLLVLAAVFGFVVAKLQGIINKAARKRTMCMFSRLTINYICGR